MTLGQSLRCLTAQAKVDHDLELNIKVDELMQEIEQWCTSMAQSQAHATNMWHFQCASMDELYVSPTPTELGLRLIEKLQSEDISAYFTICEETRYDSLRLSWSDDVGVPGELSTRQSG